MRQFRHRAACKAVVRTDAVAGEDSDVETGAASARARARMMKRSYVLEDMPIGILVMVESQDVLAASSRAGTRLGRRMTAPRATTVARAIYAGTRHHAFASARASLMVIIALLPIPAGFRSSVTGL